MNHRIKIPNSHWTVNQLTNCAKAHSLNMLHSAMSSVLENSRRFTTTFLTWSQFDFQHFLVNEPLIDLFQRTNAEELELDKLNWPFESFCLIFPRSYPVQSAIMARKNGQLRVAAVHKEGSDYTFVANLKGDQSVLEILKTTPYVETLPDNMREEYEKLTGNKLPEDEEMTAQKELRSIVFLCISCLAFMNAKPEHIWTDPTPVPRVKRHKTDQRPWIAPRWLGKHFQTRSGNRKPSNGVEPEYSVSAHWRRGHWRNQPFGPKDQHQTKLIWLEPALIGVK